MGEQALRQDIARLIALHGLGTTNGLKRVANPAFGWTEEEWNRRILEVVPGAVEAACLDLAGEILGDLSKHPVVLFAAMIDALQPFAEEADRQNRVTSYRDGGVIITHTRLTIGHLNRAKSAFAKALGQDGESAS